MLWGRTNHERIRKNLFFNKEKGFKLQIGANHWCCGEELTTNVSGKTYFSIKKRLQTSDRSQSIKPDPKV
jgi:hypothetical protein